jgi:hypothetical protein
METIKKSRPEKSIKIQPECWSYLSTLRDNLNKELGLELSISQTISILKNKFTPKKMSEILISKVSK